MVTRMLTKEMIESGGALVRNLDEKVFTPMQLFGCITPTSRNGSLLLPMLNWKKRVLESFI